MVSREEKFQVPEWEKSFGLTTLNRVKRVGVDSSNYRNETNLPQSNKEKVEIFDHYIHRLGAEVLQTLFVDEEEVSKDKDHFRKKNIRKIQVIKKRIKVSDFDDGGVSVSLDQDWDTSGWNDSQIVAACDVLIYIFYDLYGESSQERKERAVTMLQKLLERHSVAVDHIQKNVEMMIGKAASKLIRNGKSGGLLNLFYVINSVKEKFGSELSKYSFNAKVTEMFLQEARLAATLIQHTYRAKFSKRRLNKVGSIKIQGLSSEKEDYYRQLRVINARSGELRKYWRRMHQYFPKEYVNTIAGIRGPIHIHLRYIELCFSIMKFLISDEARNFAQSNREDIIRWNGCIMLSPFLNNPNTTISCLAAQIVSELAKVSESLLPIIQTGCILSAIKFIRYLRTVRGVGVEVIREKKYEKYSLLRSYIAALDIIVYSALHIAGLHRAKLGYHFIRPTSNYIETTNYQLLLNNVISSQYIDFNKQILNSFCCPAVLKEICQVLMTSTQLSMRNKSLHCILMMLSSVQCHHHVMGEITSFGGKVLLYLMQLIYSDNFFTGALVTSIFSQICCYETSRLALMTMNFPAYLESFNKDYVLKIYPQALSNNTGKIDYQSVDLLNDLPLQRSLFISLFLCRKNNWAMHDPEELLTRLLSNLPSSSTVDLKDPQFSLIPIFSTLNNSKNTTFEKFVQISIYELILRIIKDRPYDGINDDLTVSDLMILPTSVETNSKFSESLANVNNSELLIAFLIQPKISNYHEMLSLDMFAACCIIIESTCSYSFTCKTIFQFHLLKFLIKYLQLNKYLFSGKKMLNRQVIVLFSGIKAAFNALSLTSKAITQDSKKINIFYDFLIELELFDVSNFYIYALSEFSENLIDQTLLLQKEVGLSSIIFYRSIMELYNNNEEKINTFKNFDEYLFSSAKETVQILIRLQSLYGDRPDYRKEYIEIFDTLTCFLAELARHKKGAYAAIQEWDIRTMLQKYLPLPLSGISNSSFLPPIPMKKPVSRKMSRPSSGKSLNTEEFNSTKELEFQDQRNENASSTLKINMRFDILELPSSYFLLSSYICQIDQAKSFILTDGILRKNLEKLTIFQQSLNRLHKMHPDFSQFQIFKEFDWETKKKDIVESLKLIVAVANYHEAKDGSANDVILNSKYFTIVAFCSYLLQLTIKRTDDIVIYSLETLAALSRDVYKMSCFVESEDILQIVRNEVNKYLYLANSEFPQKNVNSILDIIKYSFFGITSDYLIKMIPLLREPLIKISRIFPEYDDRIREVNWVLTKSAMIYQSNLQKSLGHRSEELDKLLSEMNVNKNTHLSDTFATYSDKFSEEEKEKLTMEIYEFIRFNRPIDLDTYREETLNSMTGKFKSSIKEVGQLDSESPLDLTHKIEETAKSLDKASRVDENTGVPGEYTHCGITSCGSLRKVPEIPQTAPSKMPTNTLDFENFQLAESDSTDLLPISQLSAREKGLQNLVHERKVKSGFLKPTPNTNLKMKYKPNKNKAKTISVISCSEQSYESPTKIIVPLSPLKRIDIQELPELAMTRPTR